jgi:hypothetical protein
MIQPLDQISPDRFHEATVVSLEINEGYLIMYLESHEDTGRLPYARLEFLGAADVHRDGFPVGTMREEAEDGEVLFIEPEGRGVSMVIIWNTYEPRRTWTVGYTFMAAGFRLVESRLPEEGSSHRTSP